MKVTTVEIEFSKLLSDDDVQHVRTLVRITLDNMCLEPDVFARWRFNNRELLPEALPQQQVDVELLSADDVHTLAELAKQVGTDDEQAERAFKQATQSTDDVRTFNKRSAAQKKRWAKAKRTK